MFQNHLKRVLSEVTLCNFLATPVNSLFHVGLIEFSIQAIKLFCIPREFMDFTLSEESGKKTKHDGNSTGIQRTLGRFLQRAGVAQNSLNFLVKTGSPLLYNWNLSEKLELSPEFWAGISRKYHSDNAKAFSDLEDN